ncbi:MAG TPA: hypothetical protein PKY10_14805, partial [Lentisphaeria bacterium]|nr:hypothetical protein [Lentisphaeria bacterium]
STAFVDAQRQKHQERETHGKLSLELHRGATEDWPITTRPYSVDDAFLLLLFFAHPTINRGAITARTG